MKALTHEQIEDWFAPSKDWDEGYVKYKERRPFFNHPEAKSIFVDIPKEVDRLPLFTHILSFVGYEIRHFNGALIWFTSWGRWDELIEGIGYQVVESMHLGSGQPISFENFPGHEFRADEHLKAIGMMLQPIIFGWDAYYLPQWTSGGSSEFFLRISHDGYIEIATKSHAFYELTFKQLEKLEFDPKTELILEYHQMVREPKEEGS